MGRQQEVVLGICGGVGPVAGLQLHQLVLKHTLGGGEDQGQLGVVHLSRSEDMTDRTEYLIQVAGDAATGTPKLSCSLWQHSAHPAAATASRSLGHVGGGGGAIAQHMASIVPVDARLTQ